MVANIVCMLSAFGDYARLSYNKNDVIAVLRSSQDPTLSPSIAQEILPDGTVMQRMNFTGRGGTLSMSLKSTRMDFTLAASSPDGFSGAEAKDVLVPAFKDISDVFVSRVSKPARLAWNSSYLYLTKSESERSEFRDRFLVPVGFFEDKRLDDTLIRYAARRDVIVGLHEERLNVISTIADYAPQAEEDTTARGYRIDYDINTWQGDGRNRFSQQDVGEFVDAALEIQQQLNNEMLP